jgi:hypothetical protein
MYEECKKVGTIFIDRIWSKSSVYIWQCFAPLEDSYVLQFNFVSVNLTNKQSAELQC